MKRFLLLLVLIPPLLAATESRAGNARRDDRTKSNASKSAGPAAGVKSNASKSAGPAAGVKSDVSKSAGPAAGVKSDASKSAGPAAGVKSDASKSAGPAAATKDTVQRVVVKADKAKLVEKPGNQAKTIATLPRFMPVEALGRSGEWTEVKTPDGKTGYVSAASLTRNAFISVGTKFANMRLGPSSKEQLLTKLPEHWPLRALEFKNDWVSVADYEGDTGWIHKSTLSTDNYVIVKLKSINLRKGPGLTHPLRFTAAQNVCLKVLEEKDGWLHVEATDQDKAWCSVKIVWGYLTED